MLRRIKIIAPFTVSNDARLAKRNAKRTQTCRGQPDRARGLSMRFVVLTKMPPARVSRLSPSTCENYRTIERISTNARALLVPSLAINSREVTIEWHKAYVEISNLAQLPRLFLYNWCQWRNMYIFERGKFEENDTRNVGENVRAFSTFIVPFAGLLSWHRINEISLAIR